MPAHCLRRNTRKIPTPHSRACDSVKLHWLGQCVVVCILGLGLGHSATADDRPPIDALLKDVSRSLSSSPEKAIQQLAALQELRPSLSAEQHELFQLYSASSLGFQGKNTERVALVNQFLGGVKSAPRRSRFLYELIDGNRALGRNEDALQAMNQSILLLPELEMARDKIAVLQGALSLLYAFHAYDEALVFAERIVALDSGTTNAWGRCLGLTDQVDLQFKLGQGAIARAIAPAAIQSCDANKNWIYSLIVKTNLAVDLMHSGRHEQGIAASLPLLEEFAVSGQNSGHLTSLQETLAKAYLKTGNLERAQHFGKLAYERALAGNDLELQLETSETMAAVKRAQGELISAMEYYDKHLQLQKKVMAERSKMNLAYQRVKFESQDKANQMALLEQQNKVLNVEKQLHQGKNQNLILLVTLGAVLLVILGASFVKTLRQKNVFRKSAQIDGLTQISNRAYFTASAQAIFSQKSGLASLVLFDMDFFKRVNDTYGHGTGDWVLKTVADTVKSQLRKGEMLGRLGGEEFALCLPDTSPADALALAERCRSAIATIDSKPSGYSFALTASFGAATKGQHALSTFDETLVAADKALYVSKNGGRNRVTAYQASAGHPDTPPAAMAQPPERALPT